MTADSRIERSARHAARALGFAGVVAIAAAAVVTWIGVHDRLGPADLAVVLGRLSNSDGTPPPPLQARCDRAFEVYRQGLVPTIMVSGTRDWHGGNEAVCMRDYLLARGVPPTAIVMDSVGVDTWHTALHARDWLVAHHLNCALIVTQGFHVPRARLAFWHLRGVRVLWTHARYRDRHDLFSIARELPALVKYLFLPPE